MWLRVVVLDHAPVGERAVEPARGDDRDLALEIDERFVGSAPASPARPTRGFGLSAARVDLRLALAVVAERRRSSAPPAAPSSRSAARNSSSVRTARNGVTGNPCCARNVFSRSRCCVVCSTAPPGRTGANSAAAAAVAAGTFSNSNVTTSTPAAKPRTASRSSYGAVTSTSATWPVGVSLSGEKRVDAVAHPPRGDGEHAAELAAAEHADGRAGKNRVHA